MMEQHRPGHWGVLLIISLAVFVLVIDTTTLTVSITALVDDLNTELSAIHSIIAIYTLVKAAFMLIGAKFQDIIGRKRTFLAGAAIYGAGTLLSAISQNVVMFLVGWSILEGIGAVLMIPATVTFITGTYEGKARALAFGVWGGIAAAASTFGPIVGGYLTTFYSWRWVFAMEVFIIILIFALHGFLKETSPKETWKGFDIGGSLLSVFGLIALVLGILLIKEPAELGIVPFLIAGGIIVLFVFYLWERRQIRRERSVLLDITLITERSFLAGNVVAGGQKLVIAGFLFIFPLFYETVRGASAYDTGIALLPLTLSILVFSILGARFASWYEPKYVLLGGIVLSGAGLAVLRDTFSLTITAHDIISGSLLFGMGTGIVLSQVTNITMSSIKRERQTDASGILNTTRQMGSSLGTAIIGIVFALGLNLGLISGLPGIPPDSAVLVNGIVDAAVSQGMDWAITAMLFVIIGMFIAGLFIRETGEIV